MLTLAKTPESFVVPDGDEGGRMINGANHKGTIHLGDVDMWSFQANAGDSIAVSLGELIDHSDGLFVPSIGIVRPDGSPAAPANGYRAAQIRMAAPQTGTYTVLVTTSDVSREGVGDYALTLAKTPESFVVPGGDEGGPLSQGPNNPGKIHLGDLDQWTLHANANELITVSITEVSDDSQGRFVPSILLIRPDGSTGPYSTDYVSATIVFRALQAGT